MRFEKQAEAPPAPLPPADRRDVRVLAVDDNATNRMILSRMLTGYGCRPAVAASGAQGLEMLRQAALAGDPFRLALLDMQMPEMDGEHTATAIKADPLIQDVILVILTSMGQRGDAARLEAIGCAGYLLKPIKQAQLFEALSAVLGQRGDRDAQLRRLVTRHTLSEQKRSELRLLLAEDNPINRKLVVTLLERAGYAVDTVENGRQAAEAVRR